MEILSFFYTLDKWAWVMQAHLSYGLTPGLFSQYHTNG